MQASGGFDGDGHLFPLGHSVHTPDSSSEYFPEGQAIGAAEAVGHSKPAGQYMH